MNNFDLHIHSNNSDGSDTITALIQKIKNAKINLFSLTDHNTVQGIAEIQKYITSEMTFIPGIELTCKTEDIKCHILGYGIDNKNPDLISLIEKGKILRKQKLETRIKYLKEIWNIELTPSELDWLYSRKSVVKTHIANILVKRGLSDNNVNAMKKYLDGCKTGNTRFSGEEAVQTIKKAGGIPIWAHPLGGEGEKHTSQDEFKNKLKIMIAYGIKGLECFYSRYDTEEINFLKTCAKENNLFITGGSDYHGTNKTVALGQLNTKNTNVYPDEIKDFIKALQ